MDLIAFQIFFHFIWLYPTFNQGGVKALLQKRQAFHIILIQLIDITLFIPFMIQGFPDSGKYLVQFLCIDRLEQILLYFNVDRLFCIFKFIKAGKNNNFYNGIY